MTKKAFPRPKKRNLDQAEVQNFLQGIGFETDKIFQQWRHVTVFGKYQGKEVVFKLASTIATSRYTQKEFYWNEAVNSLPIEQRAHIVVPQNFASGKYGKLFYLIDQQFLTSPLGEPMAPLSPSVAKYLPKIAAANRDIELFRFPISAEFLKPKKASPHLSAGQKLVDAAAEWAEQVPRDLSALLNILDSSRESIRTCPAHADFVIRHMYDVDGKIGVIDGEHAGARAPYHYDVAQFYIRLRSDHQALEMAKQYLREFYKLLPKADQAIFWEELRPPLIQRYIGDLWGSAKNPTKLDELAIIGQEILADQIFAI